MMGWGRHNLLRMGKKVVMQERIIGEPIIEIETNKEIIHNHMYLNNKKWKKRPVMFKSCLQFGHLKKYFHRKEQYC